VNGECDLDGSALTVREDDRRITVRKRLRLYEEQTVPILSHYAEQRNLLEVDGEQHRENIVEEIMRAIRSMHCIAIGGQKTPTGRNLI